MLLYSLLNELITSNIFIVAYLAVTICSQNPCFDISDQLSNNLPEVRPKLHRGEPCDGKLTSRGFVDDY